MLLKTKGIVLRAIKYGETSLILTIFTEHLGLHTYMLKGIRNEKAKNKRTGLLQIASILDLVVEHKPNRQLQHIREFQTHYYYQTLQEEVIKNAIATFSVEILQKLLPKEAEIPELYKFVEAYFKTLDNNTLQKVGNFPLYFSIQCGKFFGYHILGQFSDEHSYLDAKEGGFTDKAPLDGSKLSDIDLQFFSTLNSLNSIEEIGSMQVPRATRAALLDWYIQFLHIHTEHLGAIKSLEILKTILH